MTTEEAIKVIKEGKRDFCEIYQSECLGKTCNKCEGSIAYNMAIKALEKQIPARAIPFCKGDYICPTCRTILNITDDDLYVYGIEPPKYCDECGQALDWGEEECGS